MSSPETTARVVQGPASPVALANSDDLGGNRRNTDEMRRLVEVAMSTTVASAVMRQYHPRRSWLWRQWSGTIVRRVVQKEVQPTCISSASSAS